MFNRTPTNVTYHVGDTAILPCSVRNLGTKEVIWKRKNQKHVITVGDFVFISDNSYSIDHRDDSDDWNLIIKNVQKSHAGYFECQVSTRENMNITVQLNVIAVHISGPAFIDKGQPIVLTCNASGPITPDDIDWFKDGKKVRSSAEHISIRSIRNAETKTLYSTLKIKHGEMTDSGTYICRSSDLEIESHNLMVLNGN
ncbi:hypothetical protein FSP39_007524 [Pinctada imbricata]|uniref:Ig-like domain-containing protein n=1 Tax=Pinctada imbricata TaxID=66713 RepID=A0AA88Y818_PINIB|nr:hypothetical protein FSP39_007524 [Pinctada imbricata]